MNGSLNKKQFKKNIKNTRNKIIEALRIEDEEIIDPIVIEQIEPVLKMLEDELAKIYQENCRIDIEDLEEKLKATLTSNDRSPYIRNQAENIIKRFMNLLKNDKDFLETINHNAVDSLRKTKEELGQGWIRKISKIISLDSIPKNYSKEKIEKIEKELKIELETEEELVLKSREDRAKLYRLLEVEQEEMPEEERVIITYKQLHDMFGGVRAPYSEKFKKYFKEHRDEFLRNPKYIYEFDTICNNFENIIKSNELKNKYENGHLELEDILGYLGKITFTNQREGEEKLSQLSSMNGIKNEEEYEAVQKVFDIVKERERTSVPPIYVKGKKYRGRMLSPNDIIQMFVGNITDCCQRFGDVGMGAMLLGAIEENCGIFVIEEYDEQGNPIIIGQSLVIRQKGRNGNNDRLTFDNIEISKNVKSIISIEEQEEILKIYQKAGQEAMRLDKKFLKKVLKEGKITQEIYDSLVIKEVIAGRGYNDLELIERLPLAETVVPEEANYTYDLLPYGRNIHPWIDSTEYGAHTGSNAYAPVLLAEMDNKECQEIEKRNMRGNIKSKLNDVPEWYGKVDEVNVYSNEGTPLKEEQIEIIKKIERNVYRDAQQIMNKNRVETFEDVQDCYDIYNNVGVVIGSKENWYIIYGEDDKGRVNISDIALEGGMNSQKRRKCTKTRIVIYRNSRNG